MLTKSIRSELMPNVHACRFRVPLLMLMSNGTMTLKAYSVFSYPPNMDCIDLSIAHTWLSAEPTSNRTLTNMRLVDNNKKWICHIKWNCYGFVPRLQSCQTEVLTIHTFNDFILHEHEPRTHNRQEANSTKGPLTCKNEDEMCVLRPCWMLHHEYILLSWALSAHVSVDRRILLAATRTKFHCHAESFSQFSTWNIPSCRVGFLGNWTIAVYGTISIYEFNLFFCKRMDGWEKLFEFGRVNWINRKPATEYTKTELTLWKCYLFILRHLCETVP